MSFHLRAKIIPLGEVVRLKTELYLWHQGNNLHVPSECLQIKVEPIRPKYESYKEEVA